LATVKRLKADVSSVSPSSEQIKELWVALGLYREWWSYAIGGNMATWKTRINKLNESVKLIELEGVTAQELPTVMWVRPSKHAHSTTQI